MLGAYDTLVFDCDGVVLDSNRVKTEAFRQAVMPYGGEAADAMVRYHMAHGGVSRYVKFAHFLEEIAPRLAPEVTAGPDHSALLETYASAVEAGLLSCAVTPGLEALRAATAGQRWLIVSGGDQAELRHLFAARGLDQMFDGGIFGSPDSKDVILEREQAAGTIGPKALFLGDSTYDHRAAQGAGLDFVFVSAWSEVADWPQYVSQHGLKTVSEVQELQNLPA